MKNFLVAYDITNPKRLAKVRRLVYSIALGGQKSALETLLSDSSAQRLLTKVSLLIKKNDKINIISFRGKPILLGKAKFTNFENSGLVIV